MANHRKRIVIDPTVQWAIARRIFFHWVAFFSLFLGINATIRLLLAVPNQSWGEAVTHAFAHQVPQMCIMLTILPIFLRDTLRLSNRFTGPMFRLKSSLRKLAEAAPLQPIQFRGGDFWHDVAGDFNAVLRRVRDLEHQNGLLEAEVRRLRSNEDVLPEPAVPAQAQ